MERTVTCKHCNVDAYYKLTIEYFNDSEVLTKYLCIKCVKIESKKAIDDIPAIKSLKVEPILHTAILNLIGWKLKNKWTGFWRDLMLKLSMTQCSLSIWNRASYPFGNLFIYLWKVVGLLI